MGGEYIHPVVADPELVLVPVPDPEPGEPGEEGEREKVVEGPERDTEGEPVSSPT